MGMLNTRFRTNTGFLQRLGLNLVINGGFDDASEWSVTNGGWDIDATTAGKAHCDGTQGTACWIYDTSIVIAGELYRSWITLSGRSAGSMKTRVGHGAADTGYSPARSVDGTYETDHGRPDSTLILVWGDVDFVGDCDDFIVKQRFPS